MTDGKLTRGVDMKMRKMLVLLVSLVMAISAMAQRGQGQDQERGRRGEGKMRWAKELNLSQEQMKEITEIKSSHRETMKGDRDAMKKLHDELKAMIQKDDKSDGYDATLRSKHDQITKIRSAKAQSRFDTMLKMRKILTAEQLKKFEMTGQKMRKRGKRMRRGSNRD